MNGCQGNCSTCNGRDLMPTKLGLRRVLLVMCAGCRESSIGLSTVVERRATQLPVVRDRRRPVAAWLRHLTARDETGRVLAS